MATLAEDRKVDKYRDLPRSHLFRPLSIETMRAMGPRSLELVREVGRRIALETGSNRLSAPAPFGGSAEGELCLSTRGHLTLCFDSEH